MKTWGRNRGDERELTRCTEVVVGSIHCFLMSFQTLLSERETLGIAYPPMKCPRE
jgi:hypothetical protein